MDKIIRPFIQSVSSLASHIDEMNSLNAKCAEGTCQWRSSGNLYTAIKKACSELTFDHCSFCDGYPLDVTSKKTIEHYFPKNEFRVKTYEWTNLFLCCDKCQSNANRHSPFRYTLKPGDDDYSFEKYFWFNPADGDICVNEFLEEDDRAKATAFLIRYGINDDGVRKSARKKRYSELLSIVANTDQLLERNLEQYRFIVDLVQQLRYHIK